MKENRAHSMRVGRRCTASGQQETASAGGNHSYTTHEERTRG